MPQTQIQLFAVEPQPLTQRFNLIHFGLELPLVQMTAPFGLLHIVDPIHQFVQFIFLPSQVQSHGAVVLVQQKCQLRLVASLEYPGD